MITVVRRIESLETGASDRPTQRVTIVACGELAPEHNTTDGDLVVHDGDNVERTNDVPPIPTTTTTTTN